MKYDHRLWPTWGTIGNDNYKPPSSPLCTRFSFFFVSLRSDSISWISQLSVYHQQHHKTLFRIPHVYRIPLAKLLSSYLMHISETFASISHYPPCIFNVVVMTIYLKGRWIFSKIRSSGDLVSNSNFLIWYLGTGTVSVLLSRKATIFLHRISLSSTLSFGLILGLVNMANIRPIEEGSFE